MFSPSGVFTTVWFVVCKKRKDVPCQFRRPFEGGPGGCERNGGVKGNEGVALCQGEYTFRISGGEGRKGWRVRVGAWRDMEKDQRESRSFPATNRPRLQHRKTKAPMLSRTHRNEFQLHRDQGQVSTSSGSFQNCGSGIPGLWNIAHRNMLHVLVPGSGNSAHW
jgi:hypothetical protein